MELFLVSQNCVAVLACADAPRVDHVAHEDAPITDFARVCHLQDDLHRRLHELVAAHDGQCHTFNHVGRVLHTALDALLTALPDAMHVVILKPINVRMQQCFFHILELCLADDCFNSFHVVFVFCVVNNK